MWKGGDKVNTIQKLEAIRAKCEQLLDAAAKRTPGEWTAQAPGKDELPCFSVRANGHLTCAAGNTTTATSEQNAAFISSCAGAAEAGWRATLVSIGYVIPILNNLSNAPIDPMSQRVHEVALDAANAIISAWSGIL